MNSIIVIALNTFREARRDRILYSLFLFALLIIASSLVFSTISAEQYNKIVKDFGLAAISIFGVMISIFLGTGLVYKEIERKTVYNIFSKPVERYQFILGKYLGLAITLLVITISMGLILFIVVLYVELPRSDFIKFYYKGHYFTEFFFAIYFEYLEFLIIIGIALVLSSFTTPILSIILTFLAFVMGRFSADIRLFAEEVKNPAANYFSELIYRVVPNLEKFNIRNEAVYGGDISFSLIFNTTVYALIYTCVLILLTILIFQRREFK